MLLVAVVVIVVLWLMYKQSNQSQQAKPVVSQPVLVSPAAALVTNDTAVRKCGGGLFCDGSIVPDELSMVGGDAICGAGNYLYSCVNSLGTPRWRTDRTACATGAKGACPQDAPLTATDATDNAVGVDTPAITSGSA